MRTGAIRWVRLAFGLCGVLPAVAAAASSLGQEAERLAAVQALEERGRFGEALAAVPEAGVPELECERHLLRAELTDRAGRPRQALAELAALDVRRCSVGARVAALELARGAAAEVGDEHLEAAPLERWLDLRARDYREVARMASEGKTSLQIQKVLDDDGALLASGWARLAELRGRAGDAAGARRALGEIWLRFPQSAEAQKLAKPELGGVSEEDLYGRARILAALGRLDAAVADLSALAASCKRGPVLHRVLLDLGELEERRRDGRASVSALERLLDLPDVADATAQRARYLLARTYYRRLPAQKDKALPLLAALDTQGTDSKVWEQALQFRVGVLQEEDLDAEAMALLAAEGANKDSPVRAWALEKLGWLRVSHKDWAAALEAYEALLELPAAGETRAAALFWAGRCQEALGRKEPARRLYAGAAAEFPLHWYGLQALHRLDPAERHGLPKPEPLALVARFQAQRLTAARAAKIEALLGKGLRRFAAWELQEALDEEPDNLRVLFCLAKLRAEEGDFERSVVLASQAFGTVRYAGPGRVPVEILKLLYPLAYIDPLTRFAADYRVSPALAAGLIHQESGFFSNVVSGAGAVGLMQLMPETASKAAAKLGLAVGAEKPLTTPDLNLRLGLYELGGLLRSFGGQSVPAVASYNAGPDRVGRWWGPKSARDLALFVERIPYAETRDYVKKVLGKAEAYRQLYPELEAAAR
jgi:peptidoglycan lytic transglycosylase